MYKIGYTNDDKNINVFLINRRTLIQNQFLLKGNKMGFLFGAFTSINAKSSSKLTQVYAGICVILLFIYKNIQNLSIKQMKVRWNILDVQSIKMTQKYTP